MQLRKLLTVVAALFAVAAVGGVGAASASAAVFTLESTECAPGTIWNLCWGTEENKEKELVGEQSVKAKGGENLFNVASVGVEILCTSVEDTGTAVIKQPSPLTESGKIFGALVFLGCTLEGTGTVAKKCDIPVEETTKNLVGTLTSGSIVELKPETGSVFIEIKFKNKGSEVCPATVVGTRKVTGFEEVEVENPQTLQTELTGKSVVKSGLLFIEKAAELTGSITVSFTGLGDKVDVELA